MCYPWGIPQKSSALWLDRSEVSSHCPHQSQYSHRKLCIWTTLTQSGRWPLTPGPGNHMPRNKRLEICFDFTIRCWGCCWLHLLLSVLPQTIGIKHWEIYAFHSNQRIFSLLVTLHFLFQIALQKAHQRMAHPQQLCKSRSLQACIQLLMLLTFMYPNSYFVFFLIFYSSTTC